MQFPAQMKSANSQGILSEYELDCQLLPAIDSGPFFSMKVVLKESSLGLSQAFEALFQAPILPFQFLGGATLRLYETEHLLLLAFVFPVNMFDKANKAAYRLVITLPDLVNPHGDTITDFIGKSFCVNTPA